MLTLASDRGLLDGGLKLCTKGLPERFQDHDNLGKKYDEAGVDARQIVETELKALPHNDVASEQERS